MGPAVVISTYPDEGTARRVARELVGEGVCACVNVAGISSIYSWKGGVEDVPECLAIFKAAPRNMGLLKRRIAETHPYDVPEIAELAVPSVNEPYMRWLVESAP